MGIVRKLISGLLGNYSVFFIYRFTRADAVRAVMRLDPALTLRLLDDHDARSSLDPLTQAQLQYFGPGSRAFACMQGPRVLGLCFYWAGDRYKERNFWPLGKHEAKLVQIVTSPTARGRGIASSLISWSSDAMLEREFDTLYARIWHSNTPSLRAFARAGWKRIALVIELNPLRQSQPIRLNFGRRPIRPGE